MTKGHYGIRTATHLGVADAESRVCVALADEGFGVLTEIDVAETLREKPGLERPPYRILGACNPELADKALEAEADIGLLLPCNFIIYECRETTVVAAIDAGRPRGRDGRDGRQRRDGRSHRPQCCRTGSRRNKELTWRSTEAGGVLIGCHQPGHCAAGMKGSVAVGT